MDIENLSWSDELSVGNDVMDNQHKGLLSICKRTIDLIKQGRDSTSDDAFKKIVDELIVYADEHFICEEKLLSEANYPDLEAQVKEHDKFIEELAEILHNANEYKFDYEKLENFAKHWLINHILVSDMKYKDYFAKL